MRRSSNRRVIGIAFLIVVLALFAALGYRYWYQPSYDFVEVDDAQVTGSLTRIAAPAGGQIESLAVSTGDSVITDQTLATLKVVALAPSSAAAGPSIPRVLTRVTSPVEGRIAARSVSVGDTVAPGQPLVTVADLHDLWVEADVDEARIAQIAPNQTVNVSIAALGRSFAGHVQDTGTATTEVSNPAAGALLSSDSTKKIPVRIAVEWDGAKPLPGMTAAVTIYLR